MNFGILETILTILFASLVTSFIFRKLKLPVVLGYLSVGALLGPNVLDIIPDIEAIKKLAEFGVVFLMFTVGLEFSYSKLFALKKAVFVIGGLQVILSSIITSLIGIWLGMDLLPALVVGGIVAMSSTAIVVKQLEEQHELHTQHGLNAVGILLFQDLAVIPFIILIVGLSTQSEYSMTTIFLLDFLKGLFAILSIVIIGHWVMKPVFHIIAKTLSMELFTLTVLLIALTGAWITNTLGLSYALGAFVAGIMLSETQFRHQVEIEIRPFRDILLGLFFITIGMLANITYWSTIWIWITLLLAGIILVKMLLIVVLSRFAGNNYTTSLRTGLILAQGGEFGFAILTLSMKHNMFPPEYGQTILGALLISIAISPLLIRFNKEIARFLVPKAMQSNREVINQEVSKHAEKLRAHIILCGYGRVGHHIARILKEVNVPYIGLDIDSELIKNATLSGEKVVFGDATHPDILQAAGLNLAKAVVISFDILKPTIKVLSLIRQHSPDLPVLVRCKDQNEILELRKYHPYKIIAETFEESITLSQHLLELIKIPENRVTELLQTVRKKDYDMLRQIHQ